jgi:hypothetical protein
LGVNGKANLELNILTPAGAVVNKTLSSEDFGTSGMHGIDAGETFTEKLLLNEWYEFPETGTYRIKMTLLDDDAPNPSERPSTEFFVQVGTRDPMALQRSAQGLADRAIAAKTLAERMEAASALSYIRDPLAVRELVRVLWQGSLVAHYAVDGLARIGSPEAKAALNAARYHEDKDIRALVRSALEGLQATQE